VTLLYLLLIIVYVSGKVKSEKKPQHAQPLMHMIATTKHGSESILSRLSMQSVHQRGH